MLLLSSAAGSFIIGRVFLWQDCVDCRLFLLMEGDYLPRLDELSVQIYWNEISVNLDLRPFIMIRLNSVAAFIYLSFLLP